MEELLALAVAKSLSLFFSSSACPPTVFELVCLINSDMYKGLWQPQEIKPSLSLHLCAASESSCAAAADCLAYYSLLLASALTLTSQRFPKKKERSWVQSVCSKCFLHWCFLPIFHSQFSLGGWTDRRAGGGLVLQPHDKTAGEWRLEIWDAVERITWNTHLNAI